MCTCARTCVGRILYIFTLYLFYLRHREREKERERERERASRSFSAEELFRSEASPTSVMASSNLRLIATQGGSNNTRAEIPGTILLSLFSGRDPLFAAAALHERVSLSRAAWRFVVPERIINVIRSLISLGRSGDPGREIRGCNKYHASGIRRGQQTGN